MNAPLALAPIGGGWTLALFTVYLVATVAVGLWAARRGRGTEEDYFLAGRGLSAVSMALSAVSSGRSAWLVVGASGAAWAVGLPALWFFPGYILAEALLFTTIGPRLRERSVAAGAVTVPEVLAAGPLGRDGRPGSSPLPIAPALGGLAIGLGSLGNPHILVRHMSLRDPREARRAMWTGTSWNLVMAAGALLMGLVGRALYPTEDLFGEGGREELFARLGADVSERFLFAGFAGVLLASLFAAIMSTCDSQLLVVASSFVRDLRRRRRREDGDGGARRSRIAVAATVLGAVALVLGEPPLVFDLVLVAWYALGLAFGPPLLLLCYDRRTTAAGVLAGILTGALGTVFVAYVWPAQPRGKLGWYAIPIFLAALLATWALRRRGAAGGR